MKYNLDYFTNKFDNLPYEIELVVLGTTQAHFAFDFSACKVKAANLSMTENGLEFQKAFLMKYGERIKTGAVVLITIEYPIFICKETPKDAHYLNIQYARCLLGYHPKLTRNEENEYLQNPYKYLNAPVYQYLIDGLARNSDCNHMRLYEIDKEIQELVLNGWQPEIEPIPIFDYDSEKYAVEVKKKASHMVQKVLEVIEYCKDNKWTPILVGLPYSKELNERIPIDFKKDAFYEPIKEIINKTIIEFLDYSEDNEFQSIQNYFNTWFLNKAGSMNFTNRVLNDLYSKSIL